MKFQKSKRFHTVESYATCICAWATCSCSCGVVCSCSPLKQNLQEEYDGSNNTDKNDNSISESMTNTSSQNLQL